MTTILRSAADADTTTVTFSEIPAFVDYSMRRAASLIRSELRASQVSFCSVCGHYFGAREKRFVGFSRSGEGYALCRNELRGHFGVVVEVTP